jgi:hypothetical protein
MARFPERSILRLAMVLVVTAVACLGAALVVGRVENPGKVPDGALRTRLLSLRSNAATGAIPELSEIFRYSNLIFDREFDGDYSGPLPWAERVTRGPDGSYEFTWRIKLSIKASLEINVSDGVPDDYSIELYDSSGMPLVALTDSLALPVRQAALEPDIYIIKVIADGPLDFFTIDIKAVLESPEPGEGAVAPSGGLKILRLELDRFAERDLQRLAEVALKTSKHGILSPAKGRVKGKLVDRDGKTIALANVGLSGRTRTHIEGFPSLDLILRNGSFMGIPSFKLYKPEVKSGLFDFVFLSILRDMGYPVPRQEIVTLVVNGSRMGTFFLMETESPAMFAAGRLAEGNIVGVNTKKMFFDYPYGASLGPRYFYRLKDSYSERVGRRHFLSKDFTATIDKDSFARYIAFASVNLASHGLGVDDMRFYEDPNSMRFVPIPRDLKPGIGFSETYYVAFLINLNWLISPPPYTIWPIKELMYHNYEFDRNDVRHGMRGRTKDSTLVKLEDLHFTISTFLADAGNLELANKYISHFTTNTALMKKVFSRLINTHREVRKYDQSNVRVNNSMLFLNRFGYPSLRGFASKQLSKRGPLLTDGADTWYWNFRSSTSLRKDLMPSLLAPLREGLDEGEYRDQLVLAFLAEKEIFSQLQDHAIEFPEKSFAIEEEALTVREDEALKLSPVPDRKVERFGKNKDKIANVVTPIGTHLRDGGDALVLFLVRNATEGVADYKLTMRDSMSSFEPVVNALFRIGEDTDDTTVAEAVRVTVAEIMMSHFEKGEGLRLLAFRVPLSKKTAFYTMSMPPGSVYFFPPYMYLPARQAASARPAKVPVATADTPLPDGIVRSEKGLSIPKGSVVTLTGDLEVPSGGELYIEEGAIIKIAPGSSIKLSGDLLVLGTPSARVRFVSTTGEPWGGIYAEGTRTKSVRVIIKNANFENFGTWPKTRVGANFLNGGITFYHADARIEGVRITGSLGEDALNLVNSTADIRDTVISDSFSDALDLDYTSARIEGLLINGAGGDGLDLSGSIVFCVGSSFVEAGDKGISIGEKSNVIVADSTFIGNDMGIANKDASKLELTGSRFERNRIALAEFIKKPYFTRPSSETSLNTYADNTREYQWLGFQIY